MEEDKGGKSNMLSAVELMRLGWQRDMALPLRGVKEYGPDGSWIGDKTLQVTLRERAGIIAEERVAKLGSLARGEWRPDVRKVQLTKNKKKFWQTLGHSEGGVDFLNPEEALFLLDAGMMEVYHGGVSMSVQQAYSTLLDAHLTLEHYQVFAFLSRYGYILRRHNPDLVLTEYERHLRLDQYTKVTPNKHRHKRKHPAGGPVQPQEAQGQHKVAKVEAQGQHKVPKVEAQGQHKVPKVEAQGQHKVPKVNDLNAAHRAAGAASGDTTEVVPRSDCMPESASDPKSNSASRLNSSSMSDSVPKSDPAPRSDTSSDPAPRSDTRSDPAPRSAAEAVQRDSLDTKTVEEENQNSSPPLEVLRPTSRIPYTKWDWTAVQLPDIAHRSEVTVQRPRDDLVPCCVLYGQDSYRFDVDRFKRQRRGEADWEYSLGGTSWRRHVQASNWGEYRDAYRQHQRTYRLETSPAGHLWTGDVVPLISPEDARSTGSILKKLQIVESVQLSLPHDTPSVELERGTDEYRILYDVYQPNSKFKKTAEMFPHHHLCILKFSDRLPSLGETLLLSRRCLPRVPLHFAVVDGGDMNFYVFHDVKLPVDLS